MAADIGMDEFAYGNKRYLRGIKAHVQGKESVKP